MRYKQKDESYYLPRDYVEPIKEKLTKGTKLPIDSDELIANLDGIMEYCDSYSNTGESYRYEQDSDTGYITIYWHDKENYGSIVEYEAGEIEFEEYDEYNGGCDFTIKSVEQLERFRESPRRYV